MLIGFIITGLLFSLVVGTFFAVVILGGFPETKEFKKKIIFVAISLLIGFLISGVFFIEQIKLKKDWNNGTCPKCNTEWRLSNVEHLRYGEDRKYYVCDKCGKIIYQD